MLWTTSKGFLTGAWKVLKCFWCSARAADATSASPSLSSTSRLMRRFFVGGSSGRSRFREPSGTRCTIEGGLKGFISTVSWRRLMHPRKDSKSREVKSESRVWKSRHHGLAFAKLAGEQGTTSISTKSPSYLAQYSLLTSRVLLK